MIPLQNFVPAPSPTTNAWLQISALLPTPDFPSLRYNAQPQQHLSTQTALQTASKGTGLSEITKLNQIIRNISGLVDIRVKAIKLKELRNKLAQCTLETDKFL